MSTAMRKPGDRLGDWVIDEPLTFAPPLLYKCHHREDDRVGVVKVTGELASFETGHRREVDAMLELEHPNIPSMLDHGVDADEEIAWLVMSEFSGDPLADKLLVGPPDWRDASFVFHQLASALEAVHDAGLVHRDISPSKIFISKDWTVAFIGFDLCMDAAELEMLSSPPIGDLSYLAPEVIADPQHHGARADLYAFGCVVYETLTGQSAYPAATLVQTADRAQGMLEWKTRSMALDPGEPTPDWLRNLVRKSTHPKPDKRLPDVESLVFWLEAAEAKWRNRDEDQPTQAHVALGPLSVMPTAYQAPVPTGPPAGFLYMSAAIAGSVAGLAVSTAVILFAMVAA